MRRLADIPSMSDYIAYDIATGIQYITMEAENRFMHNFVDSFYEELPVEDKLKLVLQFIVGEPKHFKHHQQWHSKRAILRSQLYCFNHTIMPISRDLTGLVCSHCETSMAADTKWCRSCLNQSFKIAPLYERVLWSGLNYTGPIHPLVPLTIASECDRAGVPFEFVTWNEWMPYALDVKEPLEKAIVTKYGERITQDDLERLTLGHNTLSPIVMGRYPIEVMARNTIMGEERNPPQKLFALNLFNTLEAREASRMEAGTACKAAP